MHPGDVLVPSGTHEVRGLAVLEHVREAYELGNDGSRRQLSPSQSRLRPTILVTITKLDLRQPGHDIRLGQDEVRSVDLDRVAQSSQIQPAGTSRAAGGRSELVASVPDTDPQTELRVSPCGKVAFPVSGRCSAEGTKLLSLDPFRQNTIRGLAVAVKVALFSAHLGGERSGADSCHVRRLDDAENTIDVVLFEPRPVEESLNARVTRGLEPRGSVKHAEEQPLRTFEHHRGVGTPDFLDDLSDVGHEGPQSLAQGTVSIEHALKVQDASRVKVVHRSKVGVGEDPACCLPIEIGQEYVQFRCLALKQLPQSLRIQKIIDEDRRAGDEVTVGWSNPASGGADLTCLPSVAVQEDVVRGDDRRLVRDRQVPNHQPTRGEFVELHHRDARIQHHTTTDDALAALCIVQYAARNLVQDDGLPVHHDGVASVWSTRTAEAVDASTSINGQVVVDG